MAQHGQFGLKMRCYSVDFLNRQPHGLAQFGWPIGAVQVEDSFTAGAHHVHVCWAVVIGEDGDTIRVESQDGWHESS